MQENLKLALLQEDLVWETPQANRDKFQAKMLQLSQDVDLFILPEMFTTGFSMNAKGLAEPAEGPTLKWMQEMARDRDAAITGSVIVTEKNQFFNRLYFVFPNGAFKKYDKRHCFTFAGEDEVYSAGMQKLVLSYRGWKICPLICYDLRFPVWARNTEAYDLIFFVANWPKKRIYAWESLLKARAIENMSYCAGVNRVGTDGNAIDYNGHSAVYDSLGVAISAEQLENECQQEVILNKSKLEANRKRFRFLQDQDPFILE